jgi:hypothetical protein
MTIARDQIRPGLTLQARYKGETFHAEAVTVDDRLRYRLADGREFRSPSGAGRAVMGGIACNGWRFWTAADTSATSPDRAETESESGMDATRAHHGPSRPHGGPSNGGP